MKIDGCIACGNCQDFVCPYGAFKFDTHKSYGYAEIDQNKCNDCEQCKTEIECLGECIK